MSVVALTGPRLQQIFFDRAELLVIMGIYGEMVAAGRWRDYALAFEAQYAAFSAFERHSDRPQIRLLKCPELRLRQGQYVLLGAAGQTLKRGHDLRATLAPVRRQALKLVD